MPDRLDAVNSNTQFYLVHSLLEMVKEVSIVLGKKSNFLKSDTEF